MDEADDGLREWLITETLLVKVRRAHLVMAKDADDARARFDFGQGWSDDDEHLADYELLKTEVRLNE
jgi:hypothetical protein